MRRSEPGVRESLAWRLTLGEGVQAAVSERELVHLVESPALLTVPTCPYFCQWVLVWHERLLPTIDLAAWLHGAPMTHGERTLAGIVAYQSAPDVMPDYGALLLTGIPERLRVTDDQACALPEHPGGWHELAWSCFRQGEAALPILDLPHLFSQSLLNR